MLDSKLPCLSLITLPLNSWLVILWPMTTHHCHHLQGVTIFLTELSSILTTCVLSPNVILLCDFNIHTDNPSCSFASLLDCLALYNMSTSTLTINTCYLICVPSSILLNSQFLISQFQTIKLFFLAFTPNYTKLKKIHFF